MAEGLTDRLRALCMAFPEVTEKVSHGRPTFFVKKSTFVQIHPEGHHQNTFPHLWCAAAPGVQEELIAAFPDRVFRPPYVGHRGWLGVRLEEPVDWEALAHLCEDAYRCVAPPKLVAAMISR